jgi:tripartite-type tricarboxylate transporter receptor subunit TctC
MASRRSFMNFTAARASALAMTVLVVSLSASLAHSQPQTDFYAGKRINLVMGSDVGGGYDALARLTARHLGHFIPGNPAVIVQAMPGGSGLIAANYLYNIAEKDGTELGLVMRNVLTAALTNPESARFDIAKFNWIGSLASESGMVIAWHTAGKEKAADLFQSEMIVGGTTGTDTEITARLLNEFTGTKLKIVTGYKGNADVQLAMERGEIQGMGNISWSNLKRLSYLPNNQVRILMQNALEKAPELPDVPLALDFAKSDIDRKVLELFFGQRLVARPVVAPPNLPADRVAILRAAFVALGKDPEFNADAKKSKLEVDPTSHEAVSAVIATIASASPEVVKLFSEATAPRK